MITATGVTIARGDRIVCEHIDLVARAGEIVGLVGPNGSGKTTMLLALSRALRRSAGTVTVDGDEVAELSRREIARRMAVVAQESEMGLPLSVRDLVSLGRLPHGSLLSYGDEADRGLVHAAMARVELLGLADRLVTELSGGERQRTLIARALAQQASHLLLDEPTNHLDLRHQFALLELIGSLECTTVIVLHDLNLAARYCDRMVLLDHGRVVATGTPDEVLRPEVLEPVYRLPVARFDIDSHPHLVFGPGTRSEHRRKAS